MAQPEASARPRRLYRCDVDLSHRHHRFERALGRSGIGTEQRRREGAGGDLPGQTPAVLAPAALAFLTAIFDDRAPQAVGFRLVVGRDLKREREFVTPFGTCLSV